MENQKSPGFLGKLFQAKTKDCCSVQIEEIKDNGANQERSNKIAEVAKSELLPGNENELSECCRK